MHVYTARRVLLFEGIMFGFKKKAGTKSFRRDMAAKLDGMSVKYVTERDENSNETVIGREGALIVKGDELLVYSSADVVMRVLIDEADMSELMSLGGAVITGFDIEHDGRERTVIAYYTK